MLTSISIGILLAGLAGLTWVTVQARLAARKKGALVPVRVRQPRPRR